MTKFGDDISTNSLHSLGIRFLFTWRRPLGPGPEPWLGLGPYISSSNGAKPMCVLELLASQPREAALTAE